MPVQTVVLQWNDIGGCAQFDDLCPRRAIYDDGTVEVTIGSGELVAQGNVDTELVRAVLDQSGADAASVLASLGPGPCRMAADGTDIELSIPAGGLLVNSCQADLFSSDQPLIAAARALGQAADAAAPVDWDAVLDG